jgi:excisionase family DNA binding protein
MAQVHASQPGSKAHGPRNAANADVALAADVADALGAIDALKDDALADAEDHLRRILVRAEGLHGRGVSVSEAARVLSVSEPTVRNWISRGALRTVDGSKPIRVSASSLGQARHTVDRLRQATDKGRLLPRALEQLQDARLRQELGGRLAQMRAGQAVPAPENDFWLLFGP